MNTGIKVKVENEVTSDGKIGYRVLKIQALTKAQLPKMYLKGQREVVLLANHGLVMYSRNTGECKSLHVDEFLSIQKMAQINVFIKAAGSHLAEVNKILTEKRASWNHGKKVTFVDGEPAHSNLKKTASSFIAEETLKQNAERYLNDAEQRSIAPLARPLTEEIVSPIAPHTLPHFPKEEEDG